MKNYFFKDYIMIKYLITFIHLLVGAYMKLYAICVNDNKFDYIYILFIFYCYIGHF